MPPRIELLPVTDFTGGLNLRANAFQLRGSESPDMLNVDLDPRGGFAMRNTIQALNEGPLTGPPESLLEFTTMNQATKQVVTNVGTALFYTTGDEFTSISLAGLTTARTVGGRHRGAIYNDMLYFGNGVDKTLTWDGSAITDRTDPGSGGAYAPDFASPAAAGENDIPIAKCFASHFDSLFVANLTLGVGGTRFPNRIRWSHPGHPMAWRSQDFIDVDVGHDGDYITAILPFNERLYIFKNNSIHVLSGYSPTTFSVSLVTSEVGAPSQEAVCMSEDSIYFWHSHTGAYRMQGGRAPQWVAERIYPAITEGVILASQGDDICLAWVKNRLWCNVATGTSTTANATYVFDPTLGAGPRGAPGGWTRFDTALGPILEWSPPLTAIRWIACLAAGNYVVDLELAGDHDTYGTDYLDLDGTGDYLTAPDTAGLSIVGDLDLVWHGSLDDWTPAAVSTLMGKWTTTANQRSYLLQVNTDGTLLFSWSVDGTAVLSATSTVATGIANGTVGWVRATIDVDNGAAGRTVTFYTSTDGVTWTILGAAVTTATATSIFNSTAVASVGAHTTGTAPMAGLFYSAKVYSGIVTATQTLAADPNISRITTTATTVVDSIPQTWTIAGNPALSVVQSQHEIESYYITRWFDAENPAQLKRWKRPEFVFERAFTSILTISAFKDYNPALTTRTFTVTPEAGDVDGSNLWGANWGTMVWGSDDDVEGVQIEKGQTLGRCRSVRLKVAGPPVSIRWAMNAITFKYIPLRIRG